ncbi:MAG TPA: NAD-dependent epimerase/dehydratase family protein [Pyrinomonadaceae bacterium]|nr:NAD-dependent epimerase/dehydratase family protein [Pyrinomonadaceae bacterium]
MRIAITGATGFVGRHLTTRLVSEGHEVVRLARRPRSGEADIVVTRLDDVNQLTEAFAGCDAVAHCAGINRELGEQTYERVHVEGTLNVVEAAASQSPAHSAPAIYVSVLSHKKAQKSHKTDF